MAGKDFSKAKKTDMSNISPDKLNKKITTYKKVEISYLDPDPRNERDYTKNGDKENDKATYESIRDSIKEGGLLEPIIIKRNPSAVGRYMIIGGHTRVRALKELGIKQVDAKILNPETEEEMFFAEASLYISNKHRDKTPLQRAAEINGLRELAEKYSHVKKVNAFIEKQTGYTTRQIQRLSNLYVAPEEIKEAVRNKELTIEDASKAVSEIKRQEKTQEQSQSTKKPPQKKKEVKEVIATVQVDKLKLKAYKAVSALESALEEYDMTLDAENEGILMDTLNKMKGMLNQ